MNENTLEDTDKKNLRNLSLQEMNDHMEFIKRRSLKQILQVTLYGFAMIGVGTMSTFLPGPSLLLGAVGMVFVILGVLPIIILWNSKYYFPFKFTNQASYTLHRWRTRQSPEWLYRDYYRRGKYCVLFGDAIYASCPEKLHTEDEEQM